MTDTPRGLPQNALNYVEKIIEVDVGNEMKSVMSSEITGLMNLTNAMSLIQQNEVETIHDMMEGNYDGWMGSNDPGMENKPSSDAINVTNALVGEFESYADACSSEAQAGISMSTTQLKMTSSNQNSAQNFVMDMIKDSDYNSGLLADGMS